MGCRNRRNGQNADWAYGLGRIGGLCSRRLPDRFGFIPTAQSSYGMSKPGEIAKTLVELTGWCDPSDGLYSRRLPADFRPTRRHGSRMGCRCWRNGRKRGGILQEWRLFNDLFLPTGRCSLCLHSTAQFAYWTSPPAEGSRHWLGIRIGFLRCPLLRTAPCSLRLHPTAQSSYGIYLNGSGHSPVRRRS